VNVQTYLYYNGTCEQAIELYKRTFNAKVLYLAHFSDAPPSLRAPGREHLVWHATMQIGETLLNMSDDTMHERFSGFSLLVHLDSREDVDSAAQELAKEGKVVLPPQKVPWAEYYGIVKDPFGVTWKLQFSGH
jgi:PhnB protein